MTVRIAVWIAVRIAVRIAVCLAVSLAITLALLALLASAVTRLTGAVGAFLVTLFLAALGLCLGASGRLCDSRYGYYRSGGNACQNK